MSAFVRCMNILARTDYMGKEDYLLANHITPKQLGAILQEWPALAEQQQNASPTIAEFLSAADDYPDIIFTGYIITPARDDCRISIEGFSHPNARAVCQAMNWHNADELTATSAWWD